MWIVAAAIFGLCTIVLGALVGLQQTAIRKAKDKYLAHERGAAPNHARRLADSSKLTRSQLRRLAQAIDYIKKGDYESGTRLLKNLGMLRRAIDLLIESGAVPLAAGTLMHVNRPHRAGNLFALHGFWEDAARCYRKASMHLEEANCYRSKGDFIAAAQIYVINDKRLEAGNCYYLAGQIDVAAEIFLEVGEFELAKKSLERLIRSREGLASLSLNRHAIDSLRGLLAKSMIEDIFIELLSVHDQLIPSVKILLATNQLETAISVVGKMPRDYYEALLSDPLITGVDAEKLAFVFMRAENIPLAGILAKHVELIQQKNRAM
jgi:tetratricopeptide (TPR) repeat protein